MVNLRTLGFRSGRTAPAPLPPLPIAGLVVGVVNLLDEAADLPQPRYLSVSDLQMVSLQFPPERESIRAITRWVRRFGGVVTSEHRVSGDGPELWCRASIDYYGIEVSAYAHIPV